MKLYNDSQKPKQEKKSAKLRTNLKLQNQVRSYSRI